MKVYKFLLFFSVFIFFSDARRDAYALIDYKTCKVLESKNIDEKIYPASLTKLMLLIITFKQIDEGKLSINDRIVISKKANGKPPSKLDVKSGESIRIKDAIYSLITKSANNVACALAEKISGSEEKFAKLMNVYCRKIGLTNTHFVNASGLFNENQYSTARDLAKLALCLMKSYPEKYYLFKTKTFTYNGQKLKNHNNMLGTRSGGIFVDGIKTGYTANSGYNVIVSGVKNGRRLLAVVIGSKTQLDRTKLATSLLNKGFSVYQTQNKIKYVRKDLKIAHHNAELINNRVNKKNQKNLLRNQRSLAKNKNLKMTEKFSKKYIRANFSRDLTKNSDRKYTLGDKLKSKNYLLKKNEKKSNSIIRNNFRNEIIVNQKVKNV